MRAAMPAPHLADFRRQSAQWAANIALLRWRQQEPAARHRAMLARHARERADFGLLVGSGPDPKTWDLVRQGLERDCELAHWRTWNDDPFYGPVFIQADGRWGSAP